MSTDLLFPYETYSGDIALREIGHGIIPSGQDMLVHELYRIVDVSMNSRDGWSTLWLRFEIDLSEAGPSNAILGEDPHVLIEVECERTHARWVAPVDSTGRPFVWSARVELHREAVAGKVVIRPLIHAGKGLKSRILAPEHKDWTIHIDEPSIPVIESSIRIVWKSFATDPDNKELNEYSDQPFFMDYGPDMPILFLNRDFHGLPELLEDRRGRRPIERALHDLENVSIGRTVWDGLFDVSASALAREDEEADVRMPDVEWQVQVIRAILPGLYPDMAEEDALNQLYEDRKNTSGVKTIESRAQVAVGRHLGADSKLATAIRGVMSAAGGGE